MCGISGFNWKDEVKITDMVGALSHRGPDARGTYVEEGISLGHDRLSIIDLSAEANQPMFDSKRELVIVFNGEIYNFQELKKELESEYDFKTKSDTEVILAGYRKWGKGVVGKLNGMFAFAIWDRRDSSLFCARDHMGVKPLYYFWDGKRFIFASEIKAILKHDVPRTLNLDALNKYLRVLYAPEPDTLIQCVYKLPPGSTLYLKDGNLNIEQYYFPQLHKKDWKYDSAETAVHAAVSSSVERQLVSDVPVGVYLSGGIDSSVVLASVSKVRKNVKTFSVGFDLEDGEEKEKFNTDSLLAKETARHFGAHHHALTIGAGEVAENLERVIASMDDPISNPTAIPMALLSSFAKQEVTVALSGDGGDELFGGYERYRMSSRVDALARIPGVKSVLPKMIRSAMEMSALDRLAQFEFEKDHRLSRVVSKEYLESFGEVKKSFARLVPGGVSKTEGLMLADLCSWLPDQALLLADKMSMMGSLEVRVPLLDREVVGLSMSLPEKFKVTPFATKKILKVAFKKELPPKLFNQPKRGWFSPGAKWIRRPEIEKIFREVLSPTYHEPSGPLFNWEALEKMLDDHISKKEYNLTVLWAVFTFQIWAKRYNICIT